jgi:RNA polymerase sigma-70 factor (ECF subfamily)
MNDSTSKTSTKIGRPEAAFAYSVARQYVGDPDDAADVAQDALLLAHRHRDTFRGQSQYRTWLYRIVATTALSHLRRVRRRRPLEVHETADGLDPLALVPASELSPEQRVALHEAAELARRELDTMGDKYSKVFRLRFEEDHSEADIARAMNLSIPTVKIRTHRARKHLQRELATRLVAA